MDITVVASSELALGIVGTTTLFKDHPKGACETIKKHSTSTTIDEATVGPGCIGPRPVSDDHDHMLDTTLPVKGRNLGHAFVGGATTSDLAVYCPDDTAPFGGSIHLGYLSVTGVTAVI